jgi:uncharacterized protein YcbK (DUF882 family)
MDWKKIKHFKREEFWCRHCFTERMDEEFMLMLDAARDQAGVAIGISSGYRCPEYDKQVGGKNNHTTGKAADLVVTTSRARFEVLDALMDVGFKRIGIGPTFIHVDTCGEEEDKPTNVIWHYYT